MSDTSGRERGQLHRVVDHCYVKLGTTLDGRAPDELVEALTWIVWPAARQLSTGV